MKKLVILLILLSGILKLNAQSELLPDQRNLIDFGNKFHYEVHFLPGHSKDSISAIILFRFSYDNITFQKSGINNLSNEVFYSIPKVEIEFENSDGIIKGRTVWQDTIKTLEYDQTISKVDFIKGFVIHRVISCKFNDPIIL